MNYQIISVKAHKVDNLRNYCAHIRQDGRVYSGQGKSKNLAIEAAERKIRMPNIIQK